VIHEVFVFADNDGLLDCRALPNERVIRGMKAQLKNMRRRVTVISNPSGQSRRELRVNEKLHVGKRTAWSACRAA
jgi:hypothetical protein